MKDVFQSLEIEPKDALLDFFGPIKTSQPGCVLQGTIRMGLAKSVKIRGITVKFKGYSSVTINKAQTDMELLPKLKCPVMERNTLSKGKHELPWELTIPNAYPQSIMAKRAIIHYKVELVINVGLSKSITAECPIVLRRHLLPRKEMAPCVETKVYQHTIPTKFHYAVDAPQIVCLEQGSIPFAIKYLCIANQKAVRSIRTQLMQVELYRCQPIAKAGAEKSRDNVSDIYQLVRKVEEIGASREYTTYIKRTVPALIHTVDSSRSSDWKRPLVIRHPLHRHLSSVLDSPLIKIHHQLEITFQFEHKFEEIKAKIPLIITTIPPESGDDKFQPTESRYGFETGPRYESLQTIAEPREDGDHGKLPRPSEDGMRTTASSFFEQSESPPPPPNIPTPRQPSLSGQNEYENSLRPSVSEIDLLPSDPSPSGTSHLKKSMSAFDIGPSVPESREAKAATPLERQQQEQLQMQQQYQQHVQQLQQRKQLRTPTTTAPSLIIDVNLANKPRSASRQRHPQRNTKENAERHGTSSSKRLHNEDGHEGLSIYSDTSLSLSSSVTASSNKSNTLLQSRPPSPVFSPAPGLPATIPLQAHEDRAVALVEETFVSTPNSITTVATSPIITPNTSSMRRGRITPSMSSLMNDAASYYSGNESTLDPDGEELGMEGEPVTGARRFMHAKLPPIPSARSSTCDLDDEREDLGPLPPIPERSSIPSIPQENDLLKPKSPRNRPTLPRLSFGMPLAESWRLAERQ